MQNLNLVYFFSPIPGKERIAAYDYFRQLSLSHRSFVGESTHFFLYSTVDLAEYGITLPDYFQVIRSAQVYAEEPHFNRVNSWLEYAKSEYFDSNSIFLDADIVSRGQAHRWMFDSVDTALALSAAPSDKTASWINAGLIWMNHQRKDLVRESFVDMVSTAERLRHTFDPRFPDKPSGVWGLDELVLTEWASEKMRAADQAPPPTLGLEEVLFVSGALSLLGRAFNFDPRSMKAGYRELPRAFIHFVGHQKDEMFERYEPIVESAGTTIRIAIESLIKNDLASAWGHLLDVEQVYPRHHLLQALLFAMAHKMQDAEERAKRIQLVRGTRYSHDERQAVRGLCASLNCLDAYAQIYNEFAA